MDGAALRKAMHGNERLVGTVTGFIRCWRAMRPAASHSALLRVKEGPGGTSEDAPLPRAALADGIAAAVRQ